MRTTVSTLALATALAHFAWTPPARAVTQPNGTTIPQGNDLQSLFDGLHDPISALADGNVIPETFVPGCSLSFTLVTRGTATFHNTFGWYNVTGRRPSDAELHALIACDAPDGYTATFDVRSEPAYTGGPVGFFLRTPQSPPGLGCVGNDCCATTARAGLPTYFTERRWNSDSTSVTTAYIHLLTFDSRSTPQTFYFAWEDLYGGGDNQFTDFVARVGNIVCAGAGGPCDTGLLGVCATGTQQCRAGTLACVAGTSPSTERCDGLDNDCNGRVDEGDGLCGDVAHVCDRGACVERCVEGACFPGQTCTARGTCVDVACADVSCGSGERCVAGQCRAACAGIVCPAAQACRAGRCVDPCAGVACDGDQLCVAGVCQPRCECRPCESGNVCRAGACVATACASQTCATGTTCVAGACVDACTGVVCPTGEACTGGACVPPGDGGGTDASTTDAARDASARMVDAAAVSRDSQTEDARDAGARDEPGLTLRSRNSCGCRVPGAPSRSGGVLVAIALATAFVQRRRRTSLSRST